MSDLELVALQLKDYIANSCISSRTEVGIPFDRILDF